LCGCGGGMDNYYSRPFLTNVTFSSNHGTFPGGGMYNYESSPTLMDVTFITNSSADGGGMCNDNSNPTLTDVTFSGNSATYAGGMENFESSPSLTNVTFSGNSVNSSWTDPDFSGGGMGNYESNPRLTNVTFSGNSASYNGGGMYNEFSNPQISNTIFWGNTASNAGAQIDNESSSSPSVSYSVVQGGYAAGTHIITTDPMLGTLGDYGGFTQTIPLLPGSYAIDTGNDTACPAIDQRGVSHPQGYCDIGAFEAIIYSIYLPLILR